jgi:hypothetical protein
LLGGAKQTLNFSVQGSLSPARDLNPEPPECAIELLFGRNIRFIIIVVIIIITTTFTNNNRSRPVALHHVPLDMQFQHTKYELKRMGYLLCPCLLI